MVKGISKQVIVVQSPDKKLFDQAIFILSDEAVQSRAVTDDLLLREAKRLIKAPGKQRQGKYHFFCLLCAMLGALITGGIWVLTSFL